VVPQTEEVPYEQVGAGEDVETLNEEDRTDWTELGTPQGVLEALLLPQPPCPSLLLPQPALEDLGLPQSPPLEPQSPPGAANVVVRSTAAAASFMVEGITRRYGACSDPPGKRMYGRSLVTSEQYERVDASNGFARECELPEGLVER